MAGSQLVLHELAHHYLPIESAELCEVHGRLHPRELLEGMGLVEPTGSSFEGAESCSPEIHHY
jgi:hypothetical protein